MPDPFGPRRPYLTDEAVRFVLIGLEGSAALAGLGQPDTSSGPENTSRIASA
jgi:hypothetical protein